ncbi:DUF4062 domain-containing protein [Geodermatophilus normandii]|uniref:DUF4062 domain-containing protein n=1 Tax=Geodermatophilus normandii TaxID=1137989 RepID=A0A6P0GDZ0_9ACTN|nr:DUF4062 domain-containing protein [Geodermatophilus normandii]
MKVFVSSTAEDLADFRVAAIRALRRLGHDVIAMEDFTAAAAFPLQRVLERVRSADAYVLLVAWRYGFIPDCSRVTNLPSTPEDDAASPGDDAGKTDDDGAKSITEWEYLAAREDPERPILPFLLTESAPWPPQHVDGFARGAAGEVVPVERVRDFRARLMRDHIVSFFSRDDELGELVSAAVTSARLSRGIRLNRLGVGSPVAGGTVTPDSSHSGALVGVVRDIGSERVVTIDIATDWWSTRLYLLAYLAARLTSVQRILVVDSGRFVGLLSVGSVIREISSIHEPIRRFEQAARARDDVQPDIGREADALISLFTSSFSDASPEDAASESAVKVDVTKANLDRWFADSLVANPIRVDNLARVSPLVLIRLFDYPGDFVPVIVGEGDDSPELSRSHVVDKPALSLQLARAYVTDLVNELT